MRRHPGRGQGPACPCGWPDWPGPESYAYYRLADEVARLRLVLFHRLEPLEVRAADSTGRVETIHTSTNRDVVALRAAGMTGSGRPKRSPSRTRVGRSRVGDEAPVHDIGQPPREAGAVKVPGELPSSTAASR
ncbi:hypothetical protein GCM10009817_12710 [Terrabacter lapilli]|uniref:Uncharacterized protein n=1 Tax=Terrabacter lapilli TaxID=436231 RepID=A0ABN2RSG2_9MICO